MGAEFCEGEKNAVATNARAGCQRTARPAPVIKGIMLAPSINRVLTFITLGRIRDHRWESTFLLKTFYR